MAADQVLRTLLDLETAERGFIITGGDDFLSPYTHALPELSPRLKRLRDLALEDGTPDAPVERLMEIATARQQELDVTIKLYRERGFLAAQEVIKSRVSKNYMDEARAITGDIRKGEVEKLTQRSEERERMARASIATLLGAGVFNLFLLGFIGIIVARAAQARLREANQRQRNVVLEAENQERRKFADALSALNTRLEQSNRELQDFAFVASHDLQEPLRKIQAFGDRLRTRFAEPLGADGKDYVERMHSAASRMAVLIQDLLDYSRVTTQGRPFVPVDLNEIVQGVLADLETRIESSDGRVEVDPLPTIEGDPVQMRQLFQNLIANALKFRKPDAAPVVTVSAATLESNGNGKAMAEIMVADNGIGFEERFVDRIFNVFQRLHGRNEYEGTGIGLAVCRKIVERHGGTITAKSAPGEGSTFIFTLPVRQTTLEIPTEQETVANGSTDHDLARR
jgi:signal transduction histidine kinase